MIEILAWLAGNRDSRRGGMFFITEMEFAILLTAGVNLGIRPAQLD
jgi:hypothetical protein